MSENIGSFPTWDGQRALEARVATLTEQWAIALRDVAALRAELETERLELAEWKESANANGAECDALRAHIAAVDALLAEARTRTADREHTWVADWGLEHSHAKEWEARAQGDELNIVALQARLAAVEALCDDEIMAAHRSLAERTCACFACLVRAAARGDYQPGDGEDFDRYAE